MNARRRRRSQSLNKKYQSLDPSTPSTQMTFGTSFGMHFKVSRNISQYGTIETVTNTDPSALRLCGKWDTAWKHQPKRDLHGQHDRPRVSRGLGVLNSCCCPWRVCTPLCEYGEFRRRLIYLRSHSSRKRALDRWGPSTSQEEIMEKLTKLIPPARQARAKEGPEAQSSDQQAKDAGQEAPSSIPYVRTCQL